MPKPQITIKDIARELNVSISTVSRALNDSPDLSAGTKERIRNYAKLHHYNPNFLALSIKKRESTLIGVIVPQITHHFFASVVEGILDVADREGYSVLLFRSHEQFEKEVRSVQRLLSSRVCGVLTSVAKETTRYDHFQELVDNDIPVIFFDRICVDIPSNRVVIDDYAGALTATEYLINTGCRKIAFFCSPMHLEISKNRRAGYMDALRKHGLPVDQELIKICDNYDDAIPVATEMLQSDDHPDAFFAVNDETALGILHATKQLHLKIPDEVSICGFTDGFAAIASDPQLTTVGQNGYDVGASAMELLLERIRYKGTDLMFKNRIIRTKLIVRETTR
ncbi:MAG: LacI family DNA-binding transcriptional regulator [Microbacter sp.]